jgi:hypothetical protein
VKRRTLLLVAAAILALAAALAIGGTSRKGLSLAPPANEPAKAAKPPVELTAEAPANPPSIASVGVESPPSAAFAPVDRSSYREEARQNPHATPRSILRFASEMATRMEDARRSPARARAVFEQLLACAGSEGLPQIRAICWVNASTLAREGGFDSTLDRARATVPDEVLELADAIGA